MNFAGAARAALARHNASKQFTAALAVLFIGFFVSCGSSSHSGSSTPNHNAYVTLPRTGAVALAPDPAIPRFGL